MPARLLLPRDRCDRCGAQAYTEWQGPHPDLGTFSFPLTLCAHHDRELAPQLEAKRWERTVDERDLLAPTPAPA